ncbi:MAG: DUF4880 domain-containing protein [Azoarcus sp.]|nr:DUF4880 domain-containing protein [Azoarcus sp.]
MEKKSATSGEGSTETTDDLEAQAWDWLRLLHSGDAREADAERFRHWVRSSPAHRAAYATVKRRWDKVALSARELLRRNADAASFHSAAPPPCPASAGPLLRTLSVGVAAACLPLGGWPGADE